MPIITTESNWVLNVFFLCETNGTLFKSRKIGILTKDIIKTYVLIVGLFVFKIIIVQNNVINIRLHRSFYIVYYFFQISTQVIVFFLNFLAVLIIPPFTQCERMRLREILYSVWLRAKIIERNCFCNHKACFIFPINEHSLAKAIWKPEGGQLPVGIRSSVIFFKCVTYSFKNQFFFK